MHLFQPFHDLFLFVSASLSGYHVSSSMVLEEARWESRHLLQEIYDNESKLLSEAVKNCTEPGKTGWDACTAAGFLTDEAIQFVSVRMVEREPISESPSQRWLKQIKDLISASRERDVA